MTILPSRSSTDCSSGWWRYATCSSCVELCGAAPEALALGSADALAEGSAVGCGDSAGEALPVAVGAGVAEGLCCFASIFSAVPKPHP